MPAQWTMIWPMQWRAASAPQTPALASMVMPGLATERAADRAGLRPIREIYADRSYGADFNLSPRTEPGAVIHDAAAAARRMLGMLREGRIVSVSGKALEVGIDTICVHGDNPAAVTMAHAIRAALEAEGWTIRSSLWPRVRCRSPRRRSGSATGAKRCRPLAAAVTHGGDEARDLRRPSARGGDGSLSRHRGEAHDGAGAGIARADRDRRRSPCRSSGSRPSSGNRASARWTARRPALGCCPAARLRRRCRARVRARGAARSGRYPMRSERGTDGEGLIAEGGEGFRA